MLLFDGLLTVFSKLALDSKSRIKTLPCLKYDLSVEQSSFLLISESNVCNQHKKLNCIFISTFILYGSVFFCLHELNAMGQLTVIFIGPLKNIERLFKSKDIDPPKKIDGYANPLSKIFCGSANWSSSKGILFGHYERQSLIK
jgi:hypothetical protein